jgi:hypothetical protein
MFFLLYVWGLFDGVLLWTSTVTIIPLFFYFAGPTPLRLKFKSQVAQFLFSPSFEYFLFSFMANCPKFFFSKDKLIVQSSKPNYSIKENRIQTFRILPKEKGRFIQNFELEGWFGSPTNDRVIDKRVSKPYSYKNLLIYFHACNRYEHLK